MSRYQLQSVFIRVNYKSQQYSDLGIALLAVDIFSKLPVKLLLRSYIFNAAVHIPAGLPAALPLGFASARCSHGVG